MISCPAAEAGLGLEVKRAQYDIVKCSTDVRCEKCLDNMLLLFDIHVNIRGGSSECDGQAAVMHTDD